MNNEETKIFDPENNTKVEQKETTDTENTNKKKGSKMTAAAAAGLGAVVGSGSAYAAEHMMDNAQQVEAEDKVEPVDEGHQAVQNTENTEAASAQESEMSSAGVQEPISSTDDEVRVIGMSVADNGKGGVATLGVLQQGDDSAVLIDVESDGIVDVLIHDDNGNGVIDDNELHDVHAEGLSTAQVVEAYVQNAQDMGTEAVVTNYDTGDQYQITQTESGFGLSPMEAQEDVYLASNDIDTGMMEA